MENAFDMVYGTYRGWTPDQCARMMNALKTGSCAPLFTDWMIYMKDIHELALCRPSAANAIVCGAFWRAIVDAC